MKALKTFCLIGLFSIIGAGQVRAVTWTLRGFRYGYCGVNDCAIMSYYGLNNSGIAGIEQGVVIGDDITYREGTVTFFSGQLPDGVKGLGCTYYQSSVKIPSYSKLIKVCTFRVVQDAWGNVNTNLSKFDTEYAATYTPVATAPAASYSAECFLNFFCVSGGVIEVGNWREQSGNASFAYDNSNGASSADMSKFITMMVSTDHAIQPSQFGAWSSLLQTAETDMWYYYKHITFDANGGAGSMRNQVFENSGVIAVNSFVRDGYAFKGWNTRADGKGRAYDNCSVITATSTDKGPVTLYAQWERIEMDVIVSESGYATVFSDKYLIVPANVEVYGFTYSNGNLVQSAVIYPGAVLHAGQGYLVKAAAGTYTFTFSTLTATAPESVLTGSTTETDTPAGNIYVWGKPDGDGYEYGFYKYTGAKIGAGRAYYVKQN